MRQKSAADVSPGDICPRSGVWIPSDNPKFFPEDYFQRVMLRNFSEGEVMPETPHGEPFWRLSPTLNNQ